MQVYDLTMMINSKTPTFPGDPKTEIKQFATIKENGWNEKRITFNTHYSTHIDAPYHMLESGEKLTDYSLQRFIGDAIVLELRYPMPDLSAVEANDIVFFCTGHSNKAFEPGYFEHNPVITPEIAEALVKKRVKIVGIDSFTPDNEPYDVHKIFFKNNILIVENLVNLDKLINKRFRCFILPLKIEDADGAPCRVMGIIE